MTHKTPESRQRVVAFTESGGRFLRILRPKFMLGTEDGVGDIPVEILTELINLGIVKVNISRRLRGLDDVLGFDEATLYFDTNRAPMPGESRRMRLAQNDFFLHNDSTVVTVAYRRIAGMDAFEYAAVSWTGNGDERFNRQDNLLHALDRFEDAPLRVSFKDMPSDALRVSSKNPEDGDIVWISAASMDAVIRKFGHHGKRSAAETVPETTIPAC